MTHEVVKHLKVHPYIYAGMKKDDKPEPDKHTIEAIVLAVEAEYNTKIELKRVKTRRSEYLEPRQMIMLLAKELTTLSLKEIGKCLTGNDEPYDHSTVIHSCTSISNQIVTNDKVKAIYDNIKSRL